MKNSKVTYKNLGLIDYQKAWDYQELIFKQIIDIKVANRDLPPSEQASTTNHILICEHPHVYTLGKSGKKENLLISADELIQKNATYYEINRGGDITYHGPGQLVVYPVLDLDNFFTDIHRYLRCLEEAVIQTLAEFDIVGERVEGFTGVWIEANSVNARKICAMGVRASRWVTMHGLALNVNTDLTYFKNIVPCGIGNKEVTSMAKELGYAPDLKQVEQILFEKIELVFGMKIEN
ncbi:MAG: lipoyl(octanoyl) transferase LipB [Cytophagales bacterium]